MENYRASISPLLRIARRRLDRLAPEVDPLLWWPSNDDLKPLFPLAKMLLAIPCSSADSERSFSSAGFTMGVRRTRLALEAFRSEHRIRRFITACGDAQTQTGRAIRLARVNSLLERYATMLAAHE